MWGREDILRDDDLENELAADFAPLVVNFTCLTGYFIHPEYDSISEKLLLYENGPIAIIAPTSLTLSDSQDQLSTALAEEIASNKYLTIGELWVQVQGKQIITNAKDKDVLLTYLLFGDPAARLP